MKIVHITSAHPALDIRIFYKECLTLIHAGHEVHLVARNCADETHLGINIHALNSDNHLSRWQRLYQIYRLTKSIIADVYHFHDPEFIPFALLLKTTKRKVIYDVHEDTPQESLSFNKNSPVKAIFKYLRWCCLEKISKLLLDGFVCATPQIAAKFPSKRTVTVRNYVKVDEFKHSPVAAFADRPNTAIYVGGIMRIRGLEEMVNAISGLPESYQPQLKLIGRFSPSFLEEEAKHFTGWEKVTKVNWVSPEQLLPHFYAAKVGLVLLYPERNFKEALPIKLFEYMAAGLPVIVSDFPLWRDIVLNVQCGFVVDPFDLAAISDKLKYIFDHPIEAEKMGLAGQKAAKELYNWQSEAIVLTRFYREHLEKKSS